MPHNLNEAIVRIRKAGQANVRAVPMEGQNVHSGNYRVEIKEGGTWVSVIEGVPKATAENIITQATNRTLLG